MMPHAHKTEWTRILRETRRVLEGIRASGTDLLPYTKTQAKVGAAAKGNPKADILTPVRQKALACQACRLAKGRHSVVFGEGSLDAKLVFVGEGPGQEEDAQGRPFVGAAGKLLDKIVQAMGLTREVVYIANVVKCRPPMNRPPLPDEISSCIGYLEAQLNTIHPQVICTLGRTAASALLKTETPMGKLRGMPLRWRDIPVVATFHPAYLLRNPSAKALVWEDMKRVLEILTP